LPNPQPFGRRESVIALTPPRPFAAAAANPRDPFSPQIAAFREELAASRATPAAGFGAWRRSRLSGTVLTWAVAIAFMSPGLLCFLLQAPVSDSMGLEVAGVVANIWVRRRRRQRLKDIVAWEEPANL
jgi:hypothetical protein